MPWYGWLIIAWTPVGLFLAIIIGDALSSAGNHYPPPATRHNPTPPPAPPGSPYATCHGCNGPLCTHGHCLTMCVPCLKLRGGYWVPPQSMPSEHSLTCTQHPDHLGPCHASYRYREPT